VTGGGSNHAAPVITEPVTPQTGYPEIRWADNGVGNGKCGWVGTCTMWVFQIWRASELRRWELICNLPGSRSRTDGKEVDELKETANRWLKWFLDDLYNTRKWPAAGGG
jgi:hypothetical protein